MPEVPQLARANPLPTPSAVDPDAGPHPSGPLRPQPPVCRPVPHVMVTTPRLPRLVQQAVLGVELRGMNSLEQPRFAHLLRAVRSATTTGHGPSACAPARRRTIAPHVTDPDIEEEILRAFIRRERADRYVAQLKKKMRREKLRFDLDNLFDLDGRWIRRLSREEDNPRALYALLRKLGAPEGCYVMSGDSEYDGAHLELRQVLNAIHATGMGTIVSCIPDRLAYYEGEDRRFILERR
jgi:hypothetical protein